MAGCGCSSAVARREMLRTQQAAPTRSGGYLLATYPDCTTLYRGTYEGYSSYVVGRNTDSERLFKLDDLYAATDYALAQSETIENLPNTGLCAQAVIDLWGE